MNFKKRTETLAIVVAKKNIQNKSVQDLRRDARRLGDFDIGYHMVIYQNGSVMKGRDIDVVAGHQFPDNETSIYVLVDMGNRGRLSDAQQKALDSIQYDFPEAEMRDQKEE